MGVKYMWRSKKFIIIAVLVALIAVGSTVGVVLAQDDSSGSSSSQTIWERAAAILGQNGTSVTAGQLESAFTQARQEIRDENVDSRLDALVASGKITQEQADQIKAWLDQKPDLSQAQQQMKDWLNSRPDVPGICGGSTVRGGMMGRFWGR
jgi:hypothetical protein